MRISVDIGHPAQVHLFKHFIWQMEKRGHEVLITASQKDISLQLLDAYGFDYVNMGSYGHSLLKKIVQIPVMDLKMYRAVRDFRPDIFVGTASARAAHVAKVLGKPSITLQDTEPGVSRDQRLYGGQTDVILTPAWYKKDLGKKQVRYRGYHELAYLHPDYFTPDPAVLDEIDVGRDERYSVVRFVGLGSHVEVGEYGIQDGKRVVKSLEKYGPVLIASEVPLPRALQPYQVRVLPEKMHDLLYYATLYVGDGGTTASEAAILGTHAIHTATTGKYCGNFSDLNQYGLLWTSEDDDQTLSRADNILQDRDIWEKGKTKRDRLVRDRVDVTKFLIWFIEHYPESIDLSQDYSEIGSLLRGAL